MSVLKSTSMFAAVIACGGILSAQGGSQSPRSKGEGAPSRCGAINIAERGYDSLVPDPKCTRSNYPLTPDEKGGTGATGPYEVIPDFFKPDFPAGWTWGRVGGIFAESPDRIYVYGSGIVPADRVSPISGLLRYFSYDPETKGVTGVSITPPYTRVEFVLTVFDRNGKRIDTWKHLDALHPSPGSYAMPHRVRVSPYDPDKHVWLIDEGSSDQIIKLTRDGKLVMRIQGKASAGTADIAFLPNGDFYALQRTGDHVIIRYSKEGKEISRMLPYGTTRDAHCLAFDKRGRMYITEFGMGRVQVFDPKGVLLDTWPNVRTPGFCAMDRNEHLWVFDGDTLAFLQYDLNGRLLSHWGTGGTYPGRFTNLNQFSVDSEGNLYTAEPVGWRPQMFRPKKGAKPQELLPQFLQ